MAFDEYMISHHETYASYLWDKWVITSNLLLIHIIITTEQERNCYTIHNYLRNNTYFKDDRPISE